MHCFHYLRLLTFYSASSIIPCAYVANVQNWPFERAERYNFNNGESQFTDTVKQISEAIQEKDKEIAELQGKYGIREVQK